MKNTARAYITATSAISASGFGIKHQCDTIEARSIHPELWNDNIPIFRIGLRVLEEQIREYGLNSNTRLEQLAIVTTKDAVSNLPYKLDVQRTLLILSTTKGNIDQICYDPDRLLMYNTAKLINDQIGLPAKPLVVSNACISGIAAITTAHRFIKDGDFDDVVIVGVDILSEFVLRGFNSFKSLSKEICKPYDKSRKGLTLGEACAVVIISNQYCEGSIEILGGAIANDANHISAPSRTGNGLIHAINSALDEAGVMAGSIDFVSAHGTGTIYNDEMEGKALSSTLLANVPMNSLKPYFGHTLGASGVLETILCCEQMKKNVVYGICGFSESGISTRLNISAEDRKVEIRRALKCGSGFGGTNAAIILGKSDVPTSPALKNRQLPSCRILRRIIIDKNTVTKFGEFISTEYEVLQDNNPKFHKMDNLSKLGYIASLKLLKDFEFNCRPEEISLVLCNRSSSVDSDLKHRRQIDTLDIDEVSPTTFVYTLANIVNGEIAIKHGIQGETSMFICNRYDESKIRKYSKSLIARGMKYVIYGWCEYSTDYYSANFALLASETFH